MNLLQFEWVPPIAAGLVAALAFWLWTRPVRRENRERNIVWSPLPLATGLAIGVVVWFVLDRPLLGVACFAAWQGGSLLLRARERERRARQDERDASEAIATAGRALRAGLPLPSVLEVVAADSRGRARDAFQEILKRESLGEELASAVRAVLLRSELPALRGFGLAVVAQLSSGGNLADTTDRLSLSLVERARVRRRARTIVTYSRLATQILVALPVAVVMILSSLIDGYTSLLLHRAEGNVILAAAALMLVAGLVLVQYLGRIDGARDRRSA